MKKLFNIIAFLAFSSLSLYSQNKRVNKVIEFNIRDVSAITDQSGVKGYYFFYKIERVNLDESVFGLKIYDENLEELATKELTLDTKTRIINMIYNGNSFCLQLLNTSDKQYEFIVYDKKLEEMTRFNISVSKDQAIDASIQSAYA